MRPGFAASASPPTIRSYAPPCVRETSGAYRHCPAHDDSRPSLSIAMGREGRVLLKCHAGCLTEDVLCALSLWWGDLFNGDER